MSLCNYCNWKAMRKTAKEEGKHLALINNNVYEVPRGKTVDEVINNGKLKEKCFKAWFMELPDRCEC